MKKILVFGYFGYANNQLDGQTVKTRAIYNLIKEKADADVNFADTQVFRRSPKAIFCFFRDLIQCDTLVWLPAQNNLRYFFPMLWYLSKVFHYRIVYIVIGGWLSTILKKLPFHQKRLGKIESILVENRLSVAELNSDYGYKNLDVIPNFRKVDIRSISRRTDGLLKLVFMARINMLKGLDTISNICPMLPENVTIDFYGPINELDRCYFFNELVNKYPCVSYKGLLQPDEISSTLQQYDAMLLPTHYYTEGLPGSIIDAYQSSLPVLVTKWKHATEFVDDGKTGFIVNFSNPEEELLDRIIRIKEDPLKLSEMKQEAYKMGLKYSPDAAWDIIRMQLMDK